MKSCCGVKRRVQAPVVMIANVAMGSAKLIVGTLMTTEPFRRAAGVEIVKLLISGFQVIDYRIHWARNLNRDWDLK